MNTTPSTPTDPMLATSRQARLKWARTARGLRTKDVAEFIGVTAPAVIKWENVRIPEDQAGITIDKLIALCQLYGVNLEWVATGKLPVESVDYGRQEADPLQVMIASQARNMANNPTSQALAAFASVQSLVVSQFVDACLSAEERELLMLYARARNLSHLPGHEFMFVAIRAALSSFLASNPTASNVSTVATPAHTG